MTYESLIALATRKGKEADYLEWLSHQPSCVSGRFTGYDENGDGRSIACHVRRIKFGSGTGHKPNYFAVPLTDGEHQVQHGKRGEQGCLFDAGWDLTQEEAKEWFEQRAVEYLKRWLNR